MNDWSSCVYEVALISVGFSHCSIFLVSRFLSVWKKRVFLEVSQFPFQKNVLRFWKVRRSASLFEKKINKSWSCLSTTLTLKKVFRHCRWADEFIRRWLSRVFFFWIDERFIARCNVFVASDHSKPLLFYPFSLLILWIVHGKMVKCHLWTDRHLSERFQFVTVFPTVSLCCRGLISLVLHTVLICWDSLWICVSHDVWRFIEILLHKAKLSLYSCLLCIKVYGMLDQFAHLYYKATKPFRCEMLRLDLDSPLAPFVSVYLRICLSPWAVIHQY